MKTKNIQKAGLILGGATLAIGAIALLNNSPSIPKKAKAVNHFQADLYLGTWYEIARFDYLFERNLNQCTAHYAKKENGTLRVTNRGYNVKTGKWEEAIGKARFAGRPDVGQLRVSFFGPFYAAYNVIALDPDYRYALVAGKNLDYLWILSQEKTIPEEVKQDYLKQAQEIGYDTSKLVWVQQNP